jgi:uncharacterized membrane protein
VPSNLPITVGDERWLWPVAIGLLGFLVLLAISYRRGSQRLPWKIALASLKFVAVALLALSLVNPLWTRTRPKTGENIVAFVADNSASLSLRGVGADSRGAELAAILQDREAPWVIRLGQDFQLRRFQIDDRVRPTEDYQSLTFTAQSSPLAGAVQSVEQRFASQPLAAIVLFTDGQATDQLLTGTLKPGIPVFPVLPRTEGVQLDLGWEGVTVSQSPFEDAPISLTAQLRGMGLPAATVAIELTKEPVPGWSNTESTAKEPLPAEETTPSDLNARQQREVVLDESGGGRVRFELAPWEVGTLFYRLRARLADEPMDSAVTREVTLLNNSSLVAIEHRAEPRRLLYVAGRPNWEHKFLGRALTDDRQLQLVSLIRIAKKEAKFDFRGRAGENTNPLFRGFKENPDEETEAYFEPVLIRLNTADETELADGFPKTKGLLYRYDGIILDDVEAEFFTRDQQTLIERFVAERGGALLMLGGIDTFQQGNWNKSSVRNALPIHLDRPARLPNGELRLQLTREGWLEPWVRLRATEAEERLRLSEMPGFRTHSAVTQLKAAARVLASVVDQQGQEYPALVAQQYGQGRSAALLTGDLWRWGLKRPDSESADLSKAWRQLARWLVAETPSRIEIDQALVSGALQLRVRVRDREFQPVENATVTVEILDPRGEVQSQPAEPTLQAVGEFAVLVQQREAGCYRVRVTAAVPGTEAELLSAESGWVHDPLATEYAAAEVNRQLMEQWAEETGGRVLQVDELESLVDLLQRRDLPVMELETRPLWHTPWLIGLALTCLLAEWGLRRWGGLP